MNLLTPKLLGRLQRDVIEALQAGRIAEASGSIEQILIQLYNSIPAGKRISYGRVHTIKILSGEMFSRLDRTAVGAFEPAAAVFTQSSSWQVRGTALGILSYAGLREYRPVLPYFRTAAASDQWELRELAQMFFKTFIKAHPRQMHLYLISLSRSPDPRLRRFVAETLRPVRENRWFYEQPEYPLSVLRGLFTESDPYPRTAVGNNLSDLARSLPELVYELVGKLVATGDANARWIAARACRNLVKRDPDRVMDLLGTNEYRYKGRRYLKRGAKI